MSDDYRIVNLYVKGDEHVLFYEENLFLPELMSIKIYGFNNLVPTHRTNLEIGIVISFPVSIVKLFENDIAFIRNMDERWYCRVHNPSNVVIKLIRNGFRKRLDLIDKYTLIEKLKK